MNNREFLYSYNGHDYVVNVTAKPFQRGTYLRYKNGAFFVSTNRLTTNKQIIKFIDKYAAKLIKNAAKRAALAYSIPQKWVYLFGEKVQLSDEINTDNIDDFLKKELVKYLDEAVPLYEEKMGVKKPYAIRVKKMNSRFGSNSLRTHSISFQLDLVHFSKPIIDSVIVHELEHHFNRDH